MRNEKKKNDHHRFFLVGENGNYWLGSINFGGVRVDHLLKVVDPKILNNNIDHFIWHIYHFLYLFSIQPLHYNFILKNCLFYRRLINPQRQ